MEGLVKDFRVGLGVRRKRVLEGISFCVREGEIFGFVGPNGAGKTTTLKVLMGLIRPSDGTARILGHDVRETEFRRHVGFLPENPYFYEFLTGREILGFYARLSGLAGRRIPERVEMLLDWVGLSHAADARLRTYSKGMLQRIGIAQALVHDPSVVFLDEPMSGLDPIGRKEVRDLIVEERARGKTVLFTSHILTDVERLCDRIGIMHQGRMSHYGALSELLAGEADRSELELAGASEELRAELEQGGCVVSEQRGHLLVVVKGPPEPVLRKAIEAGARVVSVTPAKETLEALFLRDALGGPEP